MSDDIRRWSSLTVDDIIGETGFIADGDWIESKDQDPNGEIRIIQLADIGDGTFLNKSKRFINRTSADKLKVTYLKAGDLLMARMPDPIGRVCLFEELQQPCVTVVDIAILRTQKVDSYWLMSSLNSVQVRNEIVLRSSGTTRTRIPKREIQELVLDVPPLNEQQKIAEILTSVDEVIENTQSQINKLEDLKKATMNELLTKGIGHTEFKETEIGKIPRDWTVESIGALCDLKAGGTPSTTKIEYWHGGKVPWLSSGEVHKKRIYYSDGFITELGLKESSAKLFPPKTVLVALAGQGKTRGTVAITEISSTTNQSIAGLVTRTKSLSPDYLFQNLDARYQELRHVSGGAGRAGLNLETLSNLLVPIPDLNEQQKIVEIAYEFDRQVHSVKDHLTSIKILKNSLMQDLLTGKVRVTVN